MLLHCAVNSPRKLHTNGPAIKLEDGVVGSYFYPEI
jgi:hypothetical protein